LNGTISRKKWAHWTVAVFWVLGIGLVVILAWQFRDEILNYLKNVNPLGLVRAFGWFLASLAVIVMGWVLLMRHFAPGTHWWTHVWIYVVTLAARRLPGTIWYVGGRLVLYRREGISRTLVSIASSVEYAVMIVSGALVGLILLPAAADLPIGAIAALALTAILVLISPRLVAWLAARMGQPLPVGIRMPHVLVWIAVLSLTWLTGGMMLVEIIRSFVPLPDGQTGFLLGAWALSGTLGALTFFLPSSFGATEISLAFFLAQIMPLPEAGTIAIVTRILGVGFEFFLALLFLPWLKRQAGNDP
jgi:hypothetical protein